MAQKTSEGYEKRRYARDRKKRIAAERKWQAGNKEYAEKHRVRSRVTNAVRDGSKKKPTPGAVCPNCGRKGFRKEWHHISYEPPKGEWRCSKCNPRPGG